MHFKLQGEKASTEPLRALVWGKGHDPEKNGLSLTFGTSQGLRTVPTALKMFWDSLEKREGERGREGEGETEYESGVLYPFQERHLKVGDEPCGEKLEM